MATTEHSDALRRRAYGLSTNEERPFSAISRMRPMFSGVKTRRYPGIAALPHAHPVRRGKTAVNQRFWPREVPNGAH
jgi:hypothetical protein